MPPESAPKNRPEPAAKKPVRMVRRHQVDAYRPAPQTYENFNWVRLVLVSFVSILILTVGIYFFLSRSYMGQYWLASMGRNASSEAYHELGREYMTQGSISRAVNALEIAQSKDPNNLEILIDLGKAYQGNNQIELAELAFTRAIQYWPAYPEPYQRVIDIMLGQERNFEAVKCTELAVAQCGGEYFDTLLSQMLPATPKALPTGSRYDKEIDITIESADGGIIYYSIKNEDPLVSGQIYTDPIHLPEGGWRLRAIVEKNGMYSKELVQSYTINKPTPDMPKPSLSSGTYDTVQNISLRATADVVAIYYTVDGTAPTVNSRKYESPIRLRTGATHLRAIAENADGKLSNELSINYVCKGKSNAGTMSSKDVIDKLELYKTTRENFVKTYGEPLSEMVSAKDGVGTYTRLTYAFGYAEFLSRGEGSTPILSELSVRNSASSFTFPRKTGIGVRLEEVLNAYRDEGGEDSVSGDRVLYLLTTEGGRRGFLEKTGEDEFKVSYYCYMQTDQWIELTYYSVDGLVTRIEWSRWYEAK